MKEGRKGRKIDRTAGKFRGEENGEFRGDRKNDGKTTAAA